MQVFRVEVHARLPFLADIGVATQLFLAGLGVRRGAELYLHLTAEPPSLLAWIVRLEDIALRDRQGAGEGGRESEPFAEKLSCTST